MGYLRWSRILRVGLLVVLGGAVGWWLVRPRTSDEELIAEVVARAEHGVETKSVDEIMSCVSSEYRGQGDMRREDVWRSAQQWIRSPATAQVTVENQRVTVEEGKAVGRLEVDVRLEEEGRLVRHLRLFLTVDFERERRGLRKVWLVKSMSGFDPDELIEEML